MLQASHKSRQKKGKTMTSLEIWEKRHSLIRFDANGVPRIDGQTAKNWRRYAEAVEYPIALVATKIATYLEMEHALRVSGGQD